MAERKKEPVSLATMLGVGEELVIKGKKVEVTPLTLKEVNAFVTQNFSIGPQLFNLVNEEARKYLEQVFAKHVFVDGEAVTLEKATEWDWDLNDVKEVVRKILDLSG